MFCVKCGSESVYKSGFVKGEQRYINMINVLLYVSVVYKPVFNRYPR